MKRYVMELLGTFFLTFAVSFSSFTGNPIPIGLMLMAMIYIGFHISGSHYNPALSLAVFMRNKLSFKDLVMYISMQSIGALIALLFFGYVPEFLFSSAIASDALNASALSLKSLLTYSTIMELLLTGVFCLTALSVGMLERYKMHPQGIVIGLTLIAIASLFDGIFNPAIAAAALFWNMIKDGSFAGFAPVIVHIVGPLLGGVMAALLYGFLNETHEPLHDKNNIPLR